MITIDKNDIEGITLLSIEEARELPRWLLANGDRWWLRSPSFYRCDADCVNEDGSVSYAGCLVNYDYCYVRPAIKINARPYLPLMIGEMVLVLGREAQYVGNGMVLLCESIGHRKFDDNTNNYDTSGIKAALELWLSGEKSKC
ncbi:MAG: hypothetical protein IJS71_08475 [Clostridia bacterium]|nr:hypothetical protein [Clostridia bacterium]